ncbi:MAG: AAA family ATPase [Boseongicola sp. SB0673_bin_14]|nr:AAA family ATPase [Boseongicola sp. SB0673_bin_14]
MSARGAGWMPERLRDYASLLRAVVTRLDAAQPPLIVAIAGPPATGKSTLAQRLTEDLLAAGHFAAHCPMDGFHKTNTQLAAEGLRSVKGRIDTFDAVAFAKAVARLAKGDAFWWPRYSRHRHDPVPEGTRIEGNETVCIVEGNYILASDRPWRSAAAHFGLRIFLDAPDGLLRQRLTQRHERGGKGKSETSAKIALTDMPNATEIRKSASVADFLLQEAVDG